MNEQQNVSAVQEMYAAFGRGDVASILAKLADDVAWVTHLEAVVPWAGDFSGKSNVPRFFDAIYQSVDVESFVPGEFIAKGDTVVSMGEFACKVRSTGKKSKARWIFVWQFRGGKVASYEQFQGPELAAAFR